MRGRYSGRQVLGTTCEKSEESPRDSQHGWIGADHGQHLAAFETSSNLINDRLVPLSRLTSLLPGELFREARNGRNKRSHKRLDVNGRQAGL